MSYLDIIEAMKTVKVKEIELFDLEAVILIELARLSQRAGQTPTSFDNTLFSKELAQDFKFKQPFDRLHVGEIRIILDAGATGDFGEFAGFNVVTIEKWAKMYLETDQRKEAGIKRVDSSLQLTERCKPTAEEERLILMRGLMSKFDNFKNKGTFTDFGGTSYDFLKDEGILNLTKERVWEFYNQAKDQIYTETRQEAGKEAYDKAKTLLRFAEDILNETTDAKGRIILQGKFLALKDYFQSIIELEGDIRDMFDPGDILKAFPAEPKQGKLF